MRNFPQWQALFICAAMFGSVDATAQIIDRENLVKGTIALGAADRRSLSRPARNSIYSCNRKQMDEALPHPWADRAGVIDFAKKPQVEGQVKWNSQLEVNSAVAPVLVSGNGLPNHPTGAFPIEPGSFAFRYDRNPNAIYSYRLHHSIPANPQIAPEPGCLPMGVIGVALSGAVFFNALDAPGRDAVLHEIFDECGGHPERNGRYHYHHDSPCFDQGDRQSHSPLVGYALDGYGIYGSRDAGGRYISNAELDECHGHVGPVPQVNGTQRTDYHYHINNEFPYTLGCFRGVATVPTRPGRRAAPPSPLIVPSAETISITTLGTGGPRDDEERAGPSNLIRLGERFVLVDMGRDSQRRIEQAGIRLREIDALLFTHHHLDHNEEFVPILLKARLQGGARQIIGPPGTKAFTETVLEFYREDSDYRARRTGRSGDEIRRVEIRELQGGESFSLLGAKVTTARVNHTIHTVAYRFDYGDHAIVISGDLSYSGSLIALARNADVLVIDSGQIGAAQRAGRNRDIDRAGPQRRNRGPQAHASLTEVAQMAHQAQVKKLVLSHLPPREIDERIIKDHVAQIFTGEVIVARDLLSVLP